MKTLAILFLFTTASVCHGQTGCLPQSVIEVPIRVRMIGKDITNVCSHLEMTDFTTALQEQIIDLYKPQEQAFGCQLLELQRISCETVLIRDRERADVKYLANLTCSDPCTAYVDAAISTERYSTEVNILRNAMRVNLKMTTAIGGVKIIIQYFRGRKGEVYSNCIAGTFGKISKRLDLCNCPSDCLDRCSLPPEAGICKAFFPRFFHNSTSRQCERFVYGGCGGNENNFQTLEECQQHCNVCPSGKVFQECGTACPATCDNKDDLLICTFQCVQGCVCLDGTVLNEDEDLCVAPQDCPTTQPECTGGKVFQQCGTACPTTCKDKQTVCSLLCQPGCGCPNGTVLNEDEDSCVTPEACPVIQPECPEGMEFRTCGSACPTTCSNKDELTICALQCVQGCFCPEDEGVVEHQGSCIDPADCPQ